MGNEWAAAANTLLQPVERNYLLFQLSNEKRIIWNFHSPHKGLSDTENIVPSNFIKTGTEQIYRYEWFVFWQMDNILLVILVK